MKTNLFPNLLCQLEVEQEMKQIDADLKYKDVTFLLAVVVESVLLERPRRLVAVGVGISRGETTRHKLLYCILGCMKRKGQLTHLHAILMTASLS